MQAHPTLYLILESWKLKWYFLLSTLQMEAKRAIRCRWLSLTTHQHNPAQFSNTNTSHYCTQFMKYYYNLHGCQKPNNSKDSKEVLENRWIIQKTIQIFRSYFETFKWFSFSSCRKPCKRNVFSLWNILSAFRHCWRHWRHSREYEGPNSYMWQIYFLKKKNWHINVHT